MASLHQPTHPVHCRREPSGNAYPSGFKSAYPMSQPRPHSTEQPRWGTPTPTPPPSRTGAVLKLQTSYKQPRTLPDVDDEDSMYPPQRPKHAHEKRRPSRLQPSRHGGQKSSALGSPVTPPAVVKKLSLRSQSSDLASLPEVSGDRAAARRAEAETLPRHKAEREFEHHGRKERRRSSGETQRSPLSARSDDAWGTSMYDVEVDGRR